MIKCQCLILQWGKMPGGEIVPLIMTPLNVNVRAYSKIQNNLFGILTDNMAARRNNCVVCI